MNFIYPYVQKNLLEKPEKYQMTPYFGLSFLSSFLESRKKILKDDIDEIQINELLDLLSKKEISINNLKKNNITCNLFSEILKHVLNKNFDLKIIEIVDIFLKKFEIKKKIFTSYNSEMKETTNNFSEIKNYILLSIICEVFFLHTCNLKYLNVSLKLNDLICSQNKKLNRNEQRLIQFSIIKEFESLKIISKKTGVCFI